jgi:hypothetical protein
MPDTLAASWYAGEAVGVSICDLGGFRQEKAKSTKSCGLVMLRKEFVLIMKSESIPRRRRRCVGHHRRTCAFRTKLADLNPGRLLQQE